jgi:hypothetical protein
MGATKMSGYWNIDNEPKGLNTINEPHYKDTYNEKYFYKDGREWIRNNTTGEILTVEGWAARAQEDRVAALEEERNMSPEERKRLEEHRASFEAEMAAYDARNKKASERMKARAAGEKVTRDKLVKQAEELSKEMIESGSVVSEKDLKQWRLDNGYLFEVVSPRGTVFSEMIKQVSIKFPRDYVAYNAMQLVWKMQVREEQNKSKVWRILKQS